MVLTQQIWVYKSCRSATGMLFSILSRARSVSITGYASEMGFSIFPSVTGCFLFVSMLFTSGLGYPERMRLCVRLLLRME